MATDCPLPLTPDALNCSGRGVGCFENQCICEIGWTGRGDFVVGSPACQLNIVAIRVVWGFALVLHVINLLFCLRFLWLHTSTVSKWYRSLPFTAGLFATLSSGCLGPLSLLRVITPEKTIGSDPLATFLFSSGAACFWTFVPVISFLFIQINVQGLKGRNEEEKRRIRRCITAFRTGLPFGWVFCSLACLAPLFTLIDPLDPALMYGFAAVHFVVLALVMICYFIMCLAVLGPIITDVRSILREVNDERLRILKQRMTRYKSEIRNQAIIQAISAGLFGLWPYAQRYSSYELAIAWFGSAFIMLWGISVIQPLRTRCPTSFSSDLTVAKDVYPS